MNVAYEFEYLVDKYIFDLALFDYKIFIEFDSDYHNSTDQQIIDMDKEQTAQRIGWKVIHISTDSNKVIDVSLISSLDIFKDLEEV